MTQANVHPMAPEHLPMFIPTVDGSDPLFSFLAVFGIVSILIIGALYFSLHALPEHMADDAGHTQFQVVGILVLLSLFTHNNAFWIIALLIAAFKMPDFLSPIQSIAKSLETMRNPEPPEPVQAPEPDEPPVPDDLPGFVQSIVSPEEKR